MQFESNVCEGTQKNLAVIDFSINQRCKVVTVNQMIRDYSPQPIRFILDLITVNARTIL